MSETCEQIKKNGEKCTFIAKWKVKLNNEQEYIHLMCGIHSKEKDRVQSEHNNPNYITQIITNSINLKSKKNDNIKDKIEIIIGDNKILFEDNIFNQLKYEIIKNKRNYILKCNKKDFEIKLHLNSYFKVNKGKYNKYKGKYDNYIILKNELFFDFIEKFEEKIQKDIIGNNVDLCKNNFLSIIKKYNNNKKYIILHTNNTFIKTKGYNKGILHIIFDKIWKNKNNYGLSCDIIALIT